MGNRIGTNDPLYDLSRLMTFMSGAPTQNVFNAPIILNNPAITSGIALFSHTTQPFSVAVAAASELRLFDLNFANTGAAGTQFYGIKIQTNADVVDTSAGIAIFNAGRADSIYLNVAGKAANAASNSPTGIGIDINKEIASSVERDSANSSQQGIQIFDWSTTNQGVGGPRCMLLQKATTDGMNNDHILLTLRSNRNMLQFVINETIPPFDATKPAVTFSEEDSGDTWWQISASGEQVFVKNGIGIQWITPGAKTAYILSSTNDLKLKSGGTGIRFVNQADTQTIVMMQDDLSVDIPNNETRFQALKIVSDRIENTVTNALAAVSMNYNGYNGGTTQFRDFKVFDGKQNVIAIFTGTNKNLLFGTTTDKATGTPSLFMGAGCTITPQSSGTLYIAANMWYTGAGYSRLIADNGSALIQVSYATPDIRFYFQTDANNTVDSAITYSTYHSFSKLSAVIGSGTSPGKVYLNSMIFGSMYADDISQLVTIASANTYYHVPGSLTGGTVNGFTFQNSKELLCADSGKYFVTWGMSITSATNNENISGAVMVNTTEAHNTEGSAENINAGKPVHVSGSGIITLAVNDLVRLCVQNEDAAHNITVSHADLTLVRVGA